MSLSDLLGIAARQEDEVAASARYLKIKLDNECCTDADNRVVQALFLALLELPERWAYEFCTEILEKSPKRPREFSERLTVNVSISINLSSAHPILEGEELRSNQVFLLTDVGERHCQGVIKKTNERCEIMIIGDEQEIQTKEVDKIRISANIGDLQMSLEEYLEISEGTELCFSVYEPIAVELTVSKIPTAYAMLSFKEDGVSIKILEVYGKKKSKPGNF